MEKQKTLVLVKPDAVEQNIIGEIISLLESQQLKVINMEMKTPGLEQVYCHYNKVGGLEKRLTEKLGKERAKQVVTQIVAFMTRGKVVALILEGDNAVERVRKIVGATEPEKAEDSTIRGIFRHDSSAKANKEMRALENTVHASASLEEARKEIGLWFPSS
ncbi:MAG: nucleoside-diphosphate kinase [Candidatus Absconditabacteria bacterium]|nr:nucleoside-diphosphate kinase [Candidatus Absconditabacteria bacterium]MDD3868585.1 nucleoside-diphosphate kinase [Candidatus Absconditabacteria bacterium]MDD4714746.1 nucleoside-diphosphate kinase [Candidatus Absconditabacteria bacterium]